MASASGRGRRPPEGDPVVDRAFGLLRCFDVESPALTLTELSRRSGLPLSTARRLLRQLVGAGALEQRPSGAYVIGVGLWKIGALAPRAHGLQAEALPFMEDLHEVTRHHVLLGVRERHEVVLVERLSSRSAVDVMYHVAGRLPVTDTGIGLVLLAHDTPEKQAEAIERAPAAQRSNLRRTLADARREGVAVYRRGAPWNVISVAAPIATPDDVSAALSVVVPDGADDPRRLSAAVLTTARGISRHLREGTTRRAQRPSAAATNATVRSSASAAACGAPSQRWSAPS